jgi:hypothetical protein
MRTVHIGRLLFAVECGDDRYWCELHDQDPFRIQAHVLKNGEPIRDSAFVTRDRALTWAIAEHAAIMKNCASGSGARHHSQIGA